MEGIPVPVDSDFIEMIEAGITTCEYVEPLLLSIPATLLPYPRMVAFSYTHSLILSIMFDKIHIKLSITVDRTLERA